MRARTRIVSTALLGLILLTVSMPGWATGSARAQSLDSNGCATAPSARPNANQPVLFDQFAAPLVDLAMRRRQTEMAADPEAQHRIDPSLNDHRLNVAILGYGEEHGQTYDDIGVSPTILTLNLDTWDLVTISLSRDSRVPELEDRSATAPPRDPRTLRAAYKLRGFEGVRTILESITGLSIDYQVVMKDVFLRDYLRDVSGPIQVDVPKDFHTNEYRLDGQDHAADFIPAGPQLLDTDKAMTFVLGEEMDPQGKVDERSYRKDLLLKVLSCQVRQRVAEHDVGFLFSLARFSAGALNSQSITSDFDFQLVAGGLGQMAQTLVTHPGGVDTSFPQASSARQLVIHDEAFGDGGVRRVHHMITNPDDHGVADASSVRTEIQMGSLAGYLLVPIGGDPYAVELIGNYWSAVRQLVSATLLTP